MVEKKRQGHSLDKSLHMMYNFHSASVCQWYATPNSSLCPPALISPTLTQSSMSPWPHLQRAQGGDGHPPLPNAALGPAPQRPGNPSQQKCLLL